MENSGNTNNKFQKEKSKDNHIRDEENDNFIDTVSAKTISPSKDSKEYTLHFIILFFSIFFLLLVFLYFDQAKPILTTIKANKDIIKPLNDKSQYKVVRLINGIEAILISDPEAVKSGCSLSIGVGSFSDKVSTQGLAHLTEHMIFLGSKDYPKAGALEEQIQSHSGSSNAFTDSENSAFYFEINPNGYEKAIDIFSSMFKAPLLDEKYMEKEINAVASENDKNLNNDNWREHQLLYSLADPNTPVNLFSTGNKESLGKISNGDLNKQMREYVGKYYVPDNMKLVLMSSDDISVLEEYTKYFSLIGEPTSTSTSTTSNQTLSLNFKDLYKKIYPFSEKHLGKVIYWEKKNNGQVLDIFFYNPEGINKFYKTKPYTYLSYLLSYSGEGSLLSYLISNKLATKLDAGVVINKTSFTIFGISITLTKEGFKQVNEVISLVYQFLKLLRDAPVDKDYFIEISQIETIKFKFLDKNSDYGVYLAQMAVALGDYDYEDILFSDYNYEKYNKTLISDIKEGLNPKMSLIFVGSDVLPSSKEVNGESHVEYWYKTNYIERTMSAEEMSLLEQGENIGKSAFSKKDSKVEFKLRPRNPYVSKESHLVTCGVASEAKANKASDIAITPDSVSDCITEKNETPILKTNSTALRIWYKFDRSFLLPKVNSYWDIKYNVSTTKDQLTMTIFNTFLDSYITNNLTQASEAGNSLSTEINENGITIKINAYSDMLLKISKELFEVFYKAQTEASFNQSIETTKEKLLEMANDSPYKKAQRGFKKLVKPTFFSDEELLQEIDLVNFKSYVGNYETIKQELKFTILVHGYLEEGEFDKIETLFKSHLSSPSLKPSLIPETSLYKKQHVITGSTIYRTTNNLKSELNHGINNYYQVGLKQPKESLTMSLIQLAYGNTYYNELRTNQQLGYVVFAEKSIIDNIMYFIILVQGRKETPDKVDLAIDKVTEKLKTRIDSLTQNEISAFKDNLKALIVKENVNLKEKTDDIFKEIVLETYDFNRKQMLLSTLETIVKNDVVSMFEKVFFSEPAKLSVQIYAQGSLPPIETTVLYYLNDKIRTIVTSDVNYFRKTPLIG